jgi:hypothetical protein
MFYLKKIRFASIFVATLILNMLLMILTFSRAGIATAVMLAYFFSLHHIYMKSKLIFILYIFISFSVILFFTSSFLELFLEDGSFLSKIEIFKSLKSIWNNDLLNIFFGFGVVEGAYSYSYQEGAYAHALLPLILGQFGLIGLIIYVFILIRLAVVSGFYGLLLLISIFICGLSLADPLQIMVYFAFLIMASFIRHDYNRNQKIKAC